ncbi:hypothetical protein TVAG_206930 [Trichomonas vaginalis G3]|uniref:Uncharacterized protein n=1 Tax=Trichomonas vaginalis (strain ATCC PRA-98 / G3) TaxID=412133 RepID=A2EY71_TRIV3|nr:armadillo (ARM) repeat-containing protein family [Trichomonas vaginalis G3]EAY02417.1 hypothetical protein TVAG_206930 [Trichomonas vaginalis G3]KAI5535537.1 armadillo (ARM) repeat-containing protein family [Trichomonas vaginalis G3]|eukprot:XP_001330670.1 hypothetical protein [Trichomonas vaginalis G3]
MTYYTVDEMLDIFRNNETTMHQERLKNEAAVMRMYADATKQKKFKKGSHGSKDNLLTFHQSDSNAFVLSHLRKNAGDDKDPIRDINLELNIIKPQKINESVDKLCKFDLSMVLDCLIQKAFHAVQNPEQPSSLIPVQIELFHKLLAKDSIFKTFPVELYIKYVELLSQPNYRDNCKTVLVYLSHLFVTHVISRKDYGTILYQLCSYPTLQYGLELMVSALTISGKYIDSHRLKEFFYFYRYMNMNLQNVPSYTQYLINELLFIRYKGWSDNEELKIIPGKFESVPKPVESIIPQAEKLIEERKQNEAQQIAEKQSASANNSKLTINPQNLSQSQSENDISQQDTPQNQEDEQQISSDTQSIEEPQQNDNEQPNKEPQPQNDEQIADNIEDFVEKSFNNWLDSGELADFTKFDIDLVISTTLRLFNLFNNEISDYSDFISKVYYQIVPNREDAIYHIMSNLYVIKELADNNENSFEIYDNLGMTLFNLAHIKDYIGVYDAYDILSNEVIPRDIGLNIKYSISQSIRTIYDYEILDVPEGDEDKIKQIALDVVINVNFNTQEMITDKLIEDTNNLQPLACFIFFKSMFINGFYDRTLLDNKELTDLLAMTNMTFMGELDAIVAEVSNAIPEISNDPEYKKLFYIKLN